MHSTAGTMTFTKYLANVDKFDKTYHHDEHLLYRLKIVFPMSLAVIHQ